MDSQQNALRMSKMEEKSTRPEMFSFVDRALSFLRWVIIGATLAITLVWPFQGRFGHALWILILCFAAYNVCIEVLRVSVPRLRSYAWVPALDLIIVSLLYFLDYEPGGPTFIFFYLALLTTAMSASLRWTVGYTIAIVIAVISIAPSLPGWETSPENFRQLTSRLVVMVLVGIGSSILTRRLALEYAQAQSMRDEAERLAELDRLRNDFVSSVSHDLRTPLTAIRASLGMLERKVSDRLQTDERQMWSNARRNVDRLGLLIDDLLTLNQLRAGVLQLDRDAIDMRSVVTDALSAIYPLVNEKGQPLEVDLPDPLPVMADPWRMEQVIVNVLVNAHRHTPGGTIIRLAGTNANDLAQLSISDTGPGIPDDLLEDIFQRFHRGPTGEKGSGLGLAIARGLVELHGGRLWAENQPTGGAIFYIQLPCEDQQPEPSIGSG